MLSTLAILLGLGLLIGAHEGAHMFVSKLFGVKVLKFALGFGPVLFAFKYKETSYELRVLPLGGFVQMEGEDPDSNVGFFGLPWWKRCLIAVAGPLMNLILGLLLIWLLLIIFKGWPLLLGLKKAFDLTYMIVAVTIKWIWGVIVGLKVIHMSGSAEPIAVNPTDIAGPVMVTKIMIDSMRAGFADFTFVLSIISLSLGLFNLFPIPGLDGGHIFLYILEGLKRKKFSRKVYVLWTTIGFALLVSLMFFVVYLDIMKLVK